MSDTGSKKFFDAERATEIFSTKFEHSLTRTTRPGDQEPKSTVEVYLNAIKKAKDEKYKFPGKFGSQAQPDAKRRRLQSSEMTEFVNTLVKEVQVPAIRCVSPTIEPELQKAMDALRADAEKAVEDINNIKLRVEDGENETTRIVELQCHDAASKAIINMSRDFEHVKEERDRVKLYQEAYELGKISVQFLHDCSPIVNALLSRQGMDFASGHIYTIITEIMTVHSVNDVGLREALKTPLPDDANLNEEPVGEPGFDIGFALGSHDENILKAIHAHIESDLARYKSGSSKQASNKIHKSYKLRNYLLRLADILFLNEGDMTDTEQVESGWENYRGHPVIYGTAASLSPYYQNQLDESLLSNGDHVFQLPTAKRKKTEGNDKLSGIDIAADGFRRSRPSAPPSELHKIAYLLWRSRFQAGNWTQLEQFSNRKALFQAICFLAACLVITFQTKSEFIDVTATELIEAISKYKEPLAGLLTFPATTRQNLCGRLDRCLGICSAGARQLMENYPTGTETASSFQNDFESKLDSHTFLVTLRKAMPDSATQTTRKALINSSTLKTFIEKAQAIDKALQEVNRLAYGIAALTTAEYVIPSVTPDVLDLFNPFAHPRHIFDGDEKSNELMGLFFRALVQFTEVRSMRRIRHPGFISKTVYPNSEVPDDTPSDAPIRAIKKREPEYIGQVNKTFTAAAQNAGHSRHDLAPGLYDVVKKMGDKASSVAEDNDEGGEPPTEPRPVALTLSAKQTDKWIKVSSPTKDHDTDFVNELRTDWDTISNLWDPLNPSSG